MTDGLPSTGWSRYTPEPLDLHPGRLEFGDDGAVLDADAANRVVGLGAVCGLRPPSVDDDEMTQRFWVSEYAVLASGRRVVLHDQRGFTIEARGGFPFHRESRDSIVKTTLNVVLPDDDDTGEAHPWHWLAALARTRGLDVSAEYLSGLPYEVVVSRDLSRWLSS